jgi:ABC-type lipoprotein export system ATPase subunit
MSKRVVHIRNLGLRLSNRFVVLIEALDLHAGERLVMDAPSGAGKSTALGLIAGAIADADFPGRVHLLNDRPVTAALARDSFGGPHDIGIVLQTNTLVPFLTAAENMRLPLRIARQSIDKSWERHLIGTLGLGRFLDSLPNQISVGQRQRVSIARALLGMPALLLLDEPVASLDPGNVGKVEQLISDLANAVGSAVLLASHQAQRGAFSGTNRLGCRMIEHEGTTYTLFGGVQAPNPHAGVAA